MEMDEVEENRMAQTLKLFVSDTCPRCVTIKNMNVLRNNPIELINISKKEKYIEKYGLTTVPSLLIDNKVVNDIQEIVKVIKGE